MIKLPDFFASNYIEQVHIFDRQQKAIHDNKELHDKYAQAAQNWIDANITNRAVGLPISAKPQMPLELIVEDNGNEHLSPFSDLKVPELPPLGNTPPSATSGFGIPTTNLPPDRTDQMVGMLRILNDKLDILLAKK